jgi:site-specific DNA-methyltransferase (adenine-specific)
MLASCIQGDSTKPDAWTRLLGERLGDVLLTDPPYCLLVRRRRGGDERDPKGRKNDTGPVVRRFEDVREYREFTNAWLGQAVRHLKPKAPLIIWTNLLGREPITTVARSLGYAHEIGEFVWGKRTRESNSGEELLRVVETALVFSTSRPSAPSLEAPATPWAAVAGYDDDGEAERWGNHPNHKPLGVLEPLVRTWSKPGELIVDPFAGSGSIPAAAVRLGRDAAAIERDGTWATRVQERLKEAL